jgi:hypothetical protein
MIGPKVKKTLNGIFLFGKLAILTNIGEWYEILKGRKQFFEPVNLLFHLTLTRTWSSFFKIVLLLCRLVQVNLEPMSFCHPDHNVLPPHFPSSDRIALKSPNRIHGIVSQAILQLIISTHKASCLEGQLSQ